MNIKNILSLIKIPALHFVYVYIIIYVCFTHYIWGAHMYFAYVATIVLTSLFILLPALSYLIGRVLEDKIPDRIKEIYPVITGISFVFFVISGLVVYYIYFSFTWDEIYKIYAIFISLIVLHISLLNYSTTFTLLFRGSKFGTLLKLIGVELSLFFSLMYIAAWTVGT